MNMTSVVLSVSDRHHPTVQPVSQIIERNLYQREPVANALWINPEKENCWQHVQKICTSVKLFTQDYGSYFFLKQTGAVTEYAAYPEATDKKYAWIIVNLPRQKALLRMLLDCAASQLAEDGLLWLAGENQAGIKSADKVLKSYFGHVRKLDNARHCTLFEASGVSDQPVFDPHIHRKKWLLDCIPNGLRVVSYPGVFAHGRLDAGTALLLKALADMKLEGNILDFACGSGIIGACIAAWNVRANVTLLDTNAVALKACSETLAANQLSASILASDGLSELSLSEQTGKFDTIVSNPPIHASVKTDNHLSIRLLESVHEFMNPGGTLIIVANIHLPYEKWLSQRFRYCKQLLVSDSYKVIAATI
jgi:16S rRNA (guanine1207-N2)-methyltransferase